MTLPTDTRKGQIQIAFLQILKENPDGVQAKDVIAAAASRLTLSDHEKGDYPNRPGVRRFDKILRFLTIAPVKAGWMTKEKGVWTINPVGLDALAEFQNPADLYAESSRLYRVWKKDQPDDSGDDEETKSDSTTLEEAQEVAWAEIRDFLANINPYDFQEIVAGLLRGMGYHIAWVSPPGPDKGIDILAHTDPLGVQGPRIKVQVKRTPQTKVSAETLRAFMSTLGENDVGLFVATGGFTRDAEKEAREQEKRRITLVDLQKLFDLWVEHYGSIPESERSLLPLQFVPYLAPDN
ncbi:MAG: restriction endonuclease [Gammaproteobacteria bacterium]|nr:restriction endonuclease [Gammaproteobacteria bacterium]